MRPLQIQDDFIKVILAIGIKMYYYITFLLKMILKSSIKISFQTLGLMDNLGLRFPRIFGTVLGFLDDRSFVNCRLVNKTWRDCVDNDRTNPDRTIWHRIILSKDHFCVKFNS